MKDTKPRRYAYPKAVWENMTQAQKKACENPRKGTLRRYVANKEAFRVREEAPASFEERVAKAKREMGS